MLSKIQYDAAKARALEYFKKAGIVLTEDEMEKLEVADFGLNELDDTGLELVTYVNTSRCCAKELILFPRQTCPEHHHPPVEGEPGKEETFRCRWGEVYLYIEREASKSPKAIAPKGREKAYTVWHEIILKPGQQYTLYPNTKHWFQGGPDGAVVSEFSTKSRDEADVFTDEDIQRTTQIKE